VSAVLIGVFGVLSFLYGLRSYSLLHYRPRTSKSCHEFANMTTEQLFKVKRNEEKLKELRQVIKLNKKKKHEVVDSIKEYLEYYQENSYCDYCQMVKPSRAVHCAKCKSCILRR
jgi:NADH pyrophosphatase NudC (nudix superfamily)